MSCVVSTKCLIIDLLATRYFMIKKKKIKEEYTEGKNVKGEACFWRMDVTAITMSWEYLWSSGAKPAKRPGSPPAHV